MARINISSDYEALCERKRLAEYAILKEREEAVQRAKDAVKAARERSLQFIAARKAEVLKGNAHEFLERNGWRFMGTSIFEGTKYPEAKWYANLEHLNCTHTFQMVNAIEITLALWLQKRAGVSIQEFDRYLGITIPDVTTGY